MTPEEKKAAQVALGQAYAEYMSDTASVRARLKEEFRLQLERAIEERLGELDARMGRAIARNPLPVREKQAITSSTNWYRYRKFLDAAGEVDVSSREGRLAQKLDSLKSEPGKNEDEQKTDSSKNSIEVVEVTDKMLAWEHYEGVVNDHQLLATEDSRWFEVYDTPGGMSRLWAMDSGDEAPNLVFEIFAGDDSWDSPQRAYDRGASKWDAERKAVVDAFNNGKEEK